MNKRKFESFFRAEILPDIREQYEQDRRIDYPARREAWNNLTDDMVRSGYLPQRAYEWVCPW